MGLETASDGLKRLGGRCVGCPPRPGGSWSGGATAITSQFGPIGDGQGVECFYNYALTPAIRITPDVQYVVPALRSAAPALIAGIRALVSF